MSEYKRLTQNILGDDIIRLDMEFGYNPCEKCEKFSDCEDADCEFSLSIDRLAKYEDIGSPAEFAELKKAKEEGVCYLTKDVIEALKNQGSPYDEPEGE